VIDLGGQEIGKLNSTMALFKEKMWKIFPILLVVLSIYLAMRK
jgi:hypothetical protein